MSKATFWRAAALGLAALLVALLALAAPGAFYVERIRIGGGYNTPPDGGADIGAGGTIETNGDLRFGGTGRLHVRDGLQFVLHEEDVEFLKLNAERLKPGPDGAVDLGTDAARWKDVFATNGDFNGSVTVDTECTVGVSAVQRGLLSIRQGAGAQLPGALRLYSADGTAWHVFAQNDGTLRISSSAPVNDTAGVPVGLQF